MTESLETSKIEEAKLILDEVQSLLPEPNRQGKSSVEYWYDCNREVPDPNATPNEVTRAFLSWVTKSKGDRALPLLEIRAYSEFLFKSVNSEYEPDPDFTPTMETPFSGEELELIDQHAWNVHQILLEQELYRLPKEFAESIASSLSSAGAKPEGSTLTRFRLVVNSKERSDGRPQQQSVSLWCVMMRFPDDKYPTVASHILDKLSFSTGHYRLERIQGIYEGKAYDEIYPSGRIGVESFLRADISRMQLELPEGFYAELKEMEKQELECQALMKRKFDESSINSGDIELLELIKEFLSSCVEST